jgi:hypothetical protein
MSERIVVTKKDCRDVLKEKLERDPTRGEIESFFDWLQKDVGQWLSDNAKSWIQDKAPLE